MKKQKADFSDISPYISFCPDAGEEIMEIGAVSSPVSYVLLYFRVNYKCSPQCLYGLSL